MTADNAPTETPLTLALAKLKTAGLRITKPRTLLLKLLLATDKPATIESLFDQLPNGSFDLVTLYRMLSAFEGIGLVRRTFLSNGTTTFLNERSGPVFHVASRKTGKVTLLGTDDTKELEASLAAVIAQLEAKGYTNLRHSVQFFGDQIGE